jgi:hypothetical protein
MITLVAIKLNGQNEIYEFDEKSQAECFLKEILKMNPNLEYSISVDKSNKKNHTQKNLKKR